MENHATHGLNLSLKDMVKDPSSDFTQFLNDYFLEPMTFVRREEDPTVFQRLKGQEREVAVQMIRENMGSAHAHILRAGTYLKLNETVPFAREALSTTTDLGTRVEMALILDAMNAIDKHELFSIMEKGIQTVGDIVADEIVSNAYRVLDVNYATRIIEIGLERNDSIARARSYFALQALEYIVQNGGRYTPEIGRDLLEKEIQYYTADADQSSFREEKEHFVGDEVFHNKALFATRVAELKKRLAALRM